MKEHFEDSVYVMPDGENVMEEPEQIQVTVTATIGSNGVDVKVDSNSETPMSATALFLGLMATYGVDEEEATAIFDKMSSMIDGFQKRAVKARGKYIH